MNDENEQDAVAPPVGYPLAAITDEQVGVLRVERLRALEADLVRLLLEKEESPREEPDIVHREADLVRRIDVHRRVLGLDPILDEQR